MNKKLLYWFIFFISILSIVIFKISFATTIIETPLDDDYDTIKDNSIVLGITKFEPNIVLTAGRAKTATYNYLKYNNDVEEPKIYYYLAGNWFLIDNDNNAIVVVDEKNIEDLNSSDIFYINNNEKIIKVEYDRKTEDGYDLIFRSDNNKKDNEITYEDNIVSIPATINRVDIYLKDNVDGNEKLIESFVKEFYNSAEFKLIKYEYSGNDGLFEYILLDSKNIQITRYLGEATEVTIPANYDGYKVLSIGNIDAGNNSKERFNIFGKENSLSNTSVTKIVLSEGIEVIETAAFSGCTGLTGTLDLPTTLKEIKAYAFNKCNKLKGTLVIPEGVKVIGRTAFQYCSFTSLSLPNTLEEIGAYAFNQCKGFKGDLKLPDNLKIIGDWAFQQTTGFNGILTLPKNLEILGDGAFNHSSNFTNTYLEIPAKVKTIGANDTDGTHLFYNFATNSLKEFRVDSENKYFTAVDGILYNKDVTRLISIPSYRDGVVYEIPEGIKIIDELAFSRTGSPWHVRDNENTMKKLILPNSYIISSESLPDNYLNVGSNLSVGLYKYTGIREIEVKEDNPNYKSVDGMVLSKNGKILWYVPVLKSGEIIIPDGVTTIEKGALYTAWDRIYMTTINIPASVVDIKDTEIEELEIMIKNNKKVIFDENCIYEVKSDNSIGKK